MQFREVFSYVNLLEEFQKGKYAHSIKVLFELRNNTKRWTNININIMKHPETNNIVGFFHMEAIHDEEIANSVIHSLVKLEYDYILLINTFTEKIEIYPEAMQRGTKKVNRNYRNFISDRIFAFRVN